MKAIHPLFLSLLFLIAIAAHAQTPPNDATQEVTQENNTPPVPNPKPQIIIQSVANILSHVGAIVADPHSRPNIGQNATGILANIVNIAMVAGKRACKNQLEFLTIMCDELHLDQETRHIIQQKLEEIQREIE